MEAKDPEYNGHRDLVAYAESLNKGKNALVWSPDDDKVEVLTASPSWRTT
jgi:hypothetical protein